MVSRFIMLSNKLQHCDGIWQMSQFWHVHLGLVTRWTMFQYLWHQQIHQCLPVEFDSIHGCSWRGGGGGAKTNMPNFACLQSMDVLVDHQMYTMQERNIYRERERDSGAKSAEHSSLIRQCCKTELFYIIMKEFQIIMQLKQTKLRPWRASLGH